MNAQPLEWIEMSAMASVVRRNDRSLVLGIIKMPGRDKWQPVAIETTGRPADVAAVFADHAHQVLGEMCALCRVMAVAS